MINVAGIVRKSPTNKGVDENIQLQIDYITNWCNDKFGADKYKLDLFIDKNVSGDDPNRPELKRLFDNINLYDIAVCHVIDRYIRHPRGIVWALDYFFTDDGNKPHTGCTLHFVEGIGSLYNDDNTLNPNVFVMFSLLCCMAFTELNNIRRRTNGGRQKLTAEEKKLKYKGRKKGSISNKTKVLRDKVKMYLNKGYDYKTIALKLNKSVTQIKYVLIKK